jgi:hypothetical protein
MHGKVLFPTRDCQPPRRWPTCKCKVFCIASAIPEGDTRHKTADNGWRLA